MKGIILAAGRGSRMGNLTSQSPKCLVELCGKPLLEYQLSALNQAGVSEIGIVCGYLKNKIQDQRIKKKFENAKWESTNMVISLMCASEWLRSDTCIVSYSDIFYHSSAITPLIDSDADIAITYDINFKSLWSARFENPLADLETFHIDGKSNLQEIGNRANSLDEIQGQYMGLLKFTPFGWSQVTSAFEHYTIDELDKLDMTSLLRKLITLNIPIKTIAYSNIWGEVDNCNDLKLYETWDFLKSVTES